MNYNIRDIELKDLPEVYALLQQLSNFTPDICDYRSFFTAFKQQNAIGLVYTLNNTVVGVGFIYFLQKIRGGLVGQIEDIAVHPEYHRRQIGTKLISRLVSAAIANNCYVVSLVTSKTNIPFYTMQGFIQTEFEMRKKLPLN